MLRSKSIPARLGRLGLAAVVAAAGSVVLFQGVSNAAVATYTASPLTGPSANATYVITLAGTGFADSGGTSLVHSAATGVKFATTCGANESGTTGTNATRFNVISATRLAVTTPSLTLVGTSTAFKVCVFDASANLLGSGTYTIYAAPAITAATKPASGPAFGGNTVSVTGTGFTTKATVKVDGVVATNVKVTGTTNITATVPAHAASTTVVHVVVTTEGGPNTTSSTYDNYTYKGALALSPTFGPLGTVIDLKGVGFSTLNWTNAKVYFVDGTYDPTDDTHGAKTHGAVAVDASGSAITGGAVCGTVQVVSDTEIACTAPDLAAGAYTVTVVSDGALDAQSGATYTQTVVSSGATFTISPF